MRCHLRGDQANHKLSRADRERATAPDREEGRGGGGEEEGRGEGKRRRERNNGRRNQAKRERREGRERKKERETKRRKTKKAGGGVHSQVPMHNTGKSEPSKVR